MRISDWSSDVCSSDLLPPPNVVLHTRSAMMTMLAVANSDLLTILPAQWLHLPPASPNIVVFPFRERLHAAPICMVHRADLPLTPLAGAFYDMVQKAGANYQLQPEEIGRRYQIADQATGHSNDQKSVV